MNLLDYLLPFLLALGVLILFHELGHYLVARWCGVKVLCFSIGFGKPVLRLKAGRDGTEWVLALFPLGGYVRMLDEREAPVAPQELHRAFNRQSVYRRFAIVAAGPLANFLLAIVLYWALFVSGNQELSARVALVEGSNIARSVALHDGDRILAVDGQSVRSWDELRWAVLRHALTQAVVGLDVERDGGRFTRSLDLSGIELDEGQGDPLARIGLRPFRPPIPPVVGKVVEDGAGELAGMRQGDRVSSIDGEAMDDWSQVVAAVRKAPGRVLQVEILRDGHLLRLAVTPRAEKEQGEVVGRIGVAVAEPTDRGAMFVDVRYGPWDGLIKALRQTWETSSMSLSMIGKMLVGEVSWKNLSGPVTIADYAGQSAKLGLGHYLKFLALISISLGVLNLLPIPVLDGGHLLYYTIEMIKGGPIPERVMEIGQQMGFALLMMLMAFALYNDINRLASG